MNDSMPNDSAPAFMDIADDVAGALAAGQPVVALESSVISHGMPFPDNLDTALRVADTVRATGAVPATIAILGGRLKIGLNNQQIKYLSDKSNVISKVSRRDITPVVACGGDGATTVAATMIIAAKAGIPVFATGGIGGVHRGVSDTMDISADLEELAVTGVAVVCAGIKSVLDIGMTLEYLETRGVPVLGYGTDRLPAFYCRDSGFPVDFRCDSPAAVAQVIRTKWQLGLAGGIVVAVPVPEAYALERDEVETIVTQSLAEMLRQGISGKAVTPFLLASIAEATGGRALAANRELIVSNAALAAQIADAL